jgi:hypothetical protein
MQFYEHIEHRNKNGRHIRQRTKDLPVQYKTIQTIRMPATFASTCPDIEIFSSGQGYSIQNPVLLSAGRPSILLAVLVTQMSILPFHLESTRWSHFLHNDI